MQVISRLITEILAVRTKTKATQVMGHIQLIKVVHNLQDTTKIPLLLTDNNSSNTTMEHTVTKVILPLCILLLLLMTCIHPHIRDTICRIGNLMEVYRCLCLLTTLMRIRRLQQDMNNRIRLPIIRLFVLHLALLVSVIQTRLVLCLVNFIHLHLPSNTFNRPILRLLIATIIARSVVGLKERH
jgi:hypothetical protein